MGEGAQLYSTPRAEGSDWLNFSDQVQLAHMSSIRPSEVRDQLDTVRHETAKKSNVTVRWREQLDG
jgi:hypothetical protein